jgi:hypothetical protein
MAYIRTTAAKVHHRTHQAKPIFESYIISPFPPHSEDIFLTTISYVRGTSAFKSTTPSTSTKPLPAKLPYGNRLAIPPPLDTPVYYQKLLGPHPPTAAQCHDIFQEDDMKPLLLAVMKRMNIIHPQLVMAGFLAVPPSK